MSATELSILEKLTDRLGSNPDQELTPRELAQITGVSQQVWQMRRQHNPIWAAAFYPIGLKDYRTTLRRIWAAQDTLAKQQFQTKRKAA
jgi:hypothetical protein